MNQDVTITVIDREGKSHELIAPTDMAMNLMDGLMTLKLSLLTLLLWVPLLKCKVLQILH